MGRRAGKTEWLLIELIDKAMQKPDLYWYISPSYRQSKSIAWTRLKQLLRNDELWRFNEQELSAYHTQRDTKIELRGADNEDSLRGVGLGGAGLDECAMIKANVWPEIVRPMLADKQGWAAFTSTPKGRNWFYDIYLKGIDQTEPNWQSWKYPTTVNTYITKEEVAVAQKDMSERLFKQEFLAEFLDDETGVFKRVRNCICGDLADPITGRFYVLGIDLAKSEDFSVLTVMDSVTRHVVYFERFQDITWTEQKLRIQAVAGKYNNAMCIIDATGVGDPIVEDLQNSGLSIYHENDKPGFKFTNATKCKLIDNLAIAIEQRMITFPNIEVLINEIMNFEYAISQNGIITYSAPAGKHDDAVISLALATWGIRHQLHEAQVVQNDPVLLSAQDRQGMGERVTYDEEEETEYAGY